MEPVVRLTNLKKSFGETEVIKGATLEIGKGEFCVFVGPSGCGKSTLLRMIAGLEDSTSGDIEIAGKLVNDVDPADRGVAMVFQSYALYPHMTVARNMGFGLRMTGTSRKETQARIARAAEVLRIEPLLDRKPAQLSGGQRQRVAIGRAIVRQPQVFLFDEPLSNLDAELRVAMRVEIAELHKRLGNTMIYVTHDQTEALTLADRIVVLRAGEIEQVGRPLDLYDDPDNLFVAGFLGSPRMNLLPATVTGGRAVLPGGEEIALPPLDATPADGTTVTLGLRPEHMDRPEGEGNGTLPLSVVMVEELGGTSYVHCRDAGGRAVVVERREREPTGARLTARFRPGDVRLFAGDGARLR